MTESTSAVEAAIAARIARVRAEAERRRQERAEFAAARTAGLAQRHAQKLRNLTTQSAEENPVPAALRAIHCPACHRERLARLIATVVVSGDAHDVMHCAADDCGLQWLVRAERPRSAPVAA